MSKVLIIGAGGVGGVVAHKAAMERGVFSEVMLASRRLESCRKLADEIQAMHGRTIQTAIVLCSPRATASRCSPGTFGTALPS